ncbi:hypothetical protein B4U79_12858 [Dinothrombium tinctorium]|uniref:Uncharacterized protein n=1 Tax=Dinothrombium tinctorium TaxID=1965070 RepID=A0A3S3S8W1_9ACAR|nr:hypothetical protein B4U79_02428 [Dinothrombium tinctorium]RWS10772.1 hypothetical protein B4U79_07004 [Dinothrombium tinctorium]RWS13050.1 hypothetical protein B4U79_12858 [Dinothrombium tinctorium]
METSAILNAQSILDSYFAFLGNHNYEKAKEVSEKERDKLMAKGQQTSAVLSSLLTACSQMAVGEKNYMCSNFLAPKGFLRKDNSLKVMYESLRNEFKRLKERGNYTDTNISSSIPSSTTSTPLAGTPSTPTTLSPNVETPTGSLMSCTSTTSNSSTSVSSSVPVTISSSKSTGTGIEILDYFCSHICEQLYSFVIARIEMMEIYEQLSSCWSQKFLTFENVINHLIEIVKVNGKKFHHPLLTPIKTVFTYESEALLNLLQAHCEIQNWKFLPSLFNLQDAHSKLGAWLNNAVPKDSPRRGSFGIIQKATPLHQWLCKIKYHLLAKFSLYFYTILSKQTNNQEMKSLFSKQSVDYCYKITTFQRKSDASCIMIIFDTHNGEDYKGHGYRLPKSPIEPVKGLDTFPPIVVFPADKQISNHLPSIIMMMTDKTRELNATDNLVYFYDEQVSTTYFLMRPDPRMTLVLMFDCKKTAKDPYITTFIQEIYSSLKGNKIFATLKPGSK